MRRRTPAPHKGQRRGAATGASDCAGGTTTGDGAAEDVAAQIVEDLFTAPCGFAVNHPVFLPEWSWQASEQTRLFQSCTEFGTEDYRQGLDGNQEPGVFGIDPSVIGREAARGHQHVDVWVVEHGSGPGMEYAKNAEPRAQLTWIVCQFLQGVRRGFHQR